MRTDHIYLFTTAELGRWVRDLGGKEYVPTSTLHAKMMGTPFTVCGQRATSWKRYWEVPYEVGAINSCCACNDYAVRLAGQIATRFGSSSATA